MGRAASPRRPNRAIVSCSHTPNTYELFLLVLAAARAGRIAVPVNPQMRRDEIAHVVSRLGRDAGGPQRAPGRRGRPDDRAGAGRPRRRGRAVLHVGHDRQAEGRRAHAPGARRARRPPAWPGRPCCTATRPCSRCPIAHIMGFSTLMGLACLGIPVYLLPSFRPVEVLDAIEERRATVFIGVPAMYRMMDEAGAEHRDLTSIRVWGSGADAMPADLARRFKKMGASATLPVDRPGRRGRVRRGLRHGRGRRRRGGQGLAADARRRAGRVASASSCRATSSGSSTTRAPRCAPGATGELWVQGPGRDQGLLERARGQRPRRSPTTAGCAPATSSARARSAPCCSSVARRT